MKLIKEIIKRDGFRCWPIVEVRAAPATLTPIGLRGPQKNRVPKLELGNAVENLDFGLTAPGEAAGPADGAAAFVVDVTAAVGQGTI